MIIPEISYSRLTNAELAVIQAIAAGTYFHTNETPTGIIDGVNSTFTLSAISNPTTSVRLYWNGQQLRYNIDYTILGLTLTVLIDGVTPIDSGYLSCDYTVSPV